MLYQSSLEHKNFVKSKKTQLFYLVNKSTKPFVALGLYEVKNNKKVIGNKSENREYGYNCRDKDNCQLENRCLTTSLVYTPCVTTDQNTEAKNYIRLTEGTFKHRFNRHQLSFRNKNYANSTELSKHLWKLENKENQQMPTILKIVHYCKGRPV